MLRDPLIKYHVVDDFRWRSREVSRIEGFSDAVFGFAVTLLIVSLEVPRTSTELLETMHSFGGFVVTFFMLAIVWYSQFIFFRRYYSSYAPGGTTISWRRQPVSRLLT